MSWYLVEIGSKEGFRWCHKYRVLNNGEMTGVLEFNRLTEVFGGSWYVGVIDGKSSGEGLIVN